MSWLEKAIFPLYYLTVRQEFVQRQEQLFDWHCERFFDFRVHLAKPDLDYIRLCMVNSLHYRNLSDLYSFYSYSHKVNRHTGQIDSSRLAYGLLSGESVLVEPARKIARSKGMDLAPFDDENCRFYGFGWDISDGVDKIYFRYNDFARLAEDLKRLVRGDNRPLRRQGILSFSYRDGRKVEEKIYRFTRYRFRRNSAILFSGERCVMQHNHLKWLGRCRMDRFSSASQQLIRLYQREQGLELDTYAIDPANGCEVLYFDY